MIKHFISAYTDPYKNIAIERYLAFHAEQPILYLWQNEDTVVIGKNQNSFSECDVDLLYSDGGRLARRYSGGGAVFHDMGNLNFSFLANRSDYDLDRHYEVIKKAVSSFGIFCERTGRNDVTVENKKFSGNAFYQAGENRCHHGTLLIKTNPEKLARYLTVSKEKLESKGVKSVSSRVINLSELSSEITPKSLSYAMLTAFCEVYGCESTEFSEAEFDIEELKSYEKQLTSEDWIFTKRVPCAVSIKRRYVWGGIELGFTVSGKKMTCVMLYSDAMDPELSQRVAQALEGADYSHCGVKTALMNIDVDKNILEDIERAVYENI